MYAGDSSPGDGPALVLGGGKGLERLHHGVEENADTLQVLARESEGRLRVHPLDVTDPASVATFAREVDGGGPLDALINDAGTLDRTGTLAELDFHILLRTFDINTLGALRVTTALMPALRRGASRRIACISSRAGSVSDNSSGGLYAYRLSKAALNMAVRNLALELRPEDFTVLALHPGWVRTDMGGPSAPQSPEESVRGLLQVLDGARRGHRPLPRLPRSGSALVGDLRPQCQTICKNDL